MSGLKALSQKASETIIAKLENVPDFPAGEIFVCFSFSLSTYLTRERKKNQCSKFDRMVFKLVSSRWLDTHSNLHHYFFSSLLIKIPSSSLLCLWYYNDTKFISLSLSLSKALCFKHLSNYWKKYEIFFESKRHTGGNCFFNLSLMFHLSFFIVLLNVHIYGFNLFYFLFLHAYISLLFFVCLTLTLKSLESLISYLLLWFFFNLPPPYFPRTFFLLLLLSFMKSGHLLKKRRLLIILTTCLLYNAFFCMIKFDIKKKFGRRSVVVSFSSSDIWYLCFVCATKLLLACRF